MLSQVKNGNEVSLLYPGHFSLNRKLRINKDKSFVDKPFNSIKVFEILNPLSIPLLSGIPNPKVYLKNIDVNIYIDFLKDLKVEIIHIHTLMGLNKELITAAKQLNIKTIFTSHDYFGICPKVNLINLQGSICVDYDNGKNCIDCNRNGYSNSLVVLMQSKTYRKLKNSLIIKKLRSYKQRIIIKRNNSIIEYQPVKGKNNNTCAKDYVNLRKCFIDIINNIDYIHYNSTVAKNAYEKYIDNVNSKILNISHSNIEDNRIKKSSSSNEPLKITYIGSIEKYKGLFFLLKVLEKLMKNNVNNWSLNIYGRNVNIDIDKYMGKVKIKGTYNYSELEQIFKNTDVLIVPSIWYETFGYIALEAFSYGVPVIMTDFVGFKDMIIPEVTGIIIKASEDELYNNLQTIIESREKLSYINENIIALKSIYTMKNHTEDVMKLYDDLTTFQKEIHPLP
ncbi:glycosyltransferase [Clostridium sp. FP2]|uniref:glycosyltransferase n=1 Tax=Clostridium sp. FP2 TaxID=2724481 RepID=UPI0013E97C81|nr:glycosyltransferase [Clostridium sp. FP2]MBZ9625481.1 glycosyltransferase [Clostridium sp. FP2]